MSGNVSTQDREELKRRMIERVESLLKKIDDAGVVHNAEQMRKTELEIAAVTDGIAGEIIKTVVERSLQDEQIVIQERLLAKQAPARMKNHGKREVEIHPCRGDPFTVETTYYCKAGQVNRSAAKKKGFIQG
jgi:hypothetical protein